MGGESWRVGERMQASFKRNDSWGDLHGSTIRSDPLFNIWDHLDPLNVDDDAPSTALESPKRVPLGGTNQLRDTDPDHSAACAYGQTDRRVSSPRRRTTPRLAHGARSAGPFIGHHP